MHSPIISVFGGSGFVGRVVVHALAQAGCRVRVCVRDVEAANTLRPMGTVGQVVPWPADITDAASVKAAIAGADGVVNLVGILNPWHGNTFNAIHHQGAKSVAAAAADAGVRRLVHVSALGADVASESAYARSKALGEQAVRAAFPSATILRPGVIFGPEDGFLCRFAALMKKIPLVMSVPGAKLRLRFGTHAHALWNVSLCADGGPSFQPIHVGDVAKAVRFALDSQQALGCVYELGGPGVYTFTALLERIMACTGRKKLLIPLPLLMAEMLASVTGIGPRPLLTRDQVILLRQDSIVSGDYQGLEAMNIKPLALEAGLEDCLKRFIPIKKPAMT